MSGLLSSLTNVSNAAVPFLFNALQSNEPAIQAAIVSKLTEIKTSNPAQYNMFLTNWRKLTAAIEQSAMTAPTNMLGGQDPAVLFGGATPVETEPVIPSVPLLPPNRLLLLWNLSYPQDRLSPKQQDLHLHQKQVPLDPLLLIV